MTHERSIAQKAAKKAGAVIVSLLGKAAVADKELNYNLITTADTAAEQEIRAIIAKAFPDDAFFGEEGDSTPPPLTSERLWIVDPLDGTTNFAHGIPHFAVSIAFARKGVVECGVVFNPVSGEIFAATRGNGALLNGAPLRVSKVKTLTRSVIATGFYYERGAIMLRTLESVRKLLTANIQGIRRMGSAALDLCYVACGRYDGYFEYQLSPWDFAAGALIVEEAGGCCADSDGETGRGLFSKGMICSNGALHRELCSMVL
jgi:myo-inositol-1(or 4)-monophosphatase